MSETPKALTPKDFAWMAEQARKYPDGTYAGWWVTTLVAEVERLQQQLAKQVKE